MAFQTFIASVIWKTCKDLDSLNFEKVIKPNFSWVKQPPILYSPKTGDYGGSQAPSQFVFGKAIPVLSGWTRLHLNDCSGTFWCFQITSKLYWKSLYVSGTLFSWLDISRQELLTIVFCLFLAPSRFTWAASSFCLYRFLGLPLFLFLWGFQDRAWQGMLVSSWGGRSNPVFSGLFFHRLCSLLVLFVADGFQPVDLEDSSYTGLSWWRFLLFYPIKH